MPCETKYECAAKGCDRHQHGIAPPPLRGWVLTQEREDDGTITERDYCSWECVMRDAVTVDSPAEVPFEGAA